MRGGGSQGDWEEGEEEGQGRPDWEADGERAGGGAYLVAPPARLQQPPTGASLPSSRSHSSSRERPILRQYGPRDLWIELWVILARGKVRSELAHDFRTQYLTHPKGWSLNSRFPNTKPNSVHPNRT
jgi:hypothetical protein